MTAVELHDAAERAAVAREWQALEEAVADPRLVTRWDWVETWLRHYGDLVPHRFALAPGRGAALVTESVRRRGVVTVRALHLGTAGEPAHETAYAPYNALLAAPGAEAEFARALAARLRDERRWDELVAERLAPAAAAAIVPALGGAAVEHAQAPTVDLRAASAHDGDVLATLRSRTRQQTRRSMRDLGELAVEVAESSADAAAILDELIDLHQRRWTAEGEPGVFASARFSAFQRDLVDRLMPSGRVMLFRVRSGRGTVGCIYNLIDGNRVLSYLQGFMAFEDRKLKPGFVSHVLCMQACFERGYSEYDLLPDASPYKLELSNVSRELVTARLVRPRPALAALAAGRRARRYVRGRMAARGR